MRAIAGLAAGGALMEPVPFTWDHPLGSGSGRGGLVPHMAWRVMGSEGVGGMWRMREVGVPCPWGFQCVKAVCVWARRIRLREVSTPDRWGGTKRKERSVTVMSSAAMERGRGL